MTLLPDELQQQLSVVLDPGATLENATLAFYRFRKTLETPENAAILQELRSHNLEVVVAEILPVTDCGEIEAEAPCEIEPSAEEIAEAFPEQPSLLATAVTRSGAPDYWDLAKRRTLHFGKYGRKDPEGPRTFFWVYENDPGWLEWALDETEQFDSATTAMVCHMLDR